jgi:peptide/nickel transport system ATP-binding protein
MTALLEVAGLWVDIARPGGDLAPVRDVDLSIAAGETLCVVGESGCGKSLTALAVMGLLPHGARRRARRLTFAGEDLLAIPERRMNALRGDRITMIFQDPMTALNPVFSIGDQLQEAWRRHRPGRNRQARDRAVELLERVGIAGAAERLTQFPHELSGGLRQRVMIALALMCGPDLIVADEPTTALDVTIQAQILHLLADLQRELRMGLFLITHDLGVVARIADRVAVMYAGEVVETGGAAELFAAPLHPYTRGLMACIPVPGQTPPGQPLGSIAGMVPPPVDRVACSFANRCPYALPACRIDRIALREFAAGRASRCILDEALV